MIQSNIHHIVFYLLTSKNFFSSEILGLFKNANDTQKKFQ